MWAILMAKAKPLSTKEALAILGQVINNPDRKLANRYEYMTFAQINELIDECANDLEKLPPFAFSKIEAITAELSEMAMAIDIKLARGDPH